MNVDILGDASVETADLAVEALLKAAEGGIQAVAAKAAFEKLKTRGALASKHAVYALGRVLDSTDDLADDPGYQ